YICALLSSLTHTHTNTCVHARTQTNTCASSLRHITTHKPFIFIQKSHINFQRIPGEKYTHTHTHTHTPARCTTAPIHIQTHQPRLQLPQYTYKHTSHDYNCTNTHSNTP